LSIAKHIPESEFPGYPLCLHEPGRQTVGDGGDMTKKGIWIPSRWATVLCLLLVGAVLVFIRFDLGNAFSLLLHGERATGEAEAVDDAQWVVKFRTPDGSIVRKRYDAVTWSPSKSPEVLYDPLRPMRFIMRGELTGPIALFSILILASGFSLACLIRQFVLVAKGRSGTSVRPADHEPR